MTSGTGPWPRLPGACRGHGVQGPAKQSFAPPSLGEQSPQASPSVLGGQEEPSTSGGAASAASSLQTPDFFPSLPSSLHLFPLCHCHLEVTALPTLPATHLGHTRHG